MLSNKIFTTQCPKPPEHQAAFTLLELIIVIVILSIVSIYVLTRPDSASTYRQDAVIEQIIASATLTQQLSMNDSARTFALNIQSNQISLTEDGNPFSGGTTSYPLSFGSQVTLSPVTTVSFDTLGRTTAITVAVQTDTTKNVCFEASGYVHRC